MNCPFSGEMIVSFQELNCPFSKMSVVGLSQKVRTSATPWNFGTVWFLDHKMPVNRGGGGQLIGAVFGNVLMWKDFMHKHHDIMDIQELCWYPTYHIGRRRLLVLAIPGIFFNSTKPYEINHVQFGHPFLRPGSRRRQRFGISLHGSLVFVNKGRWDSRWDKVSQRG